MSEEQLEKLKYPIGKFVAPTNYTSEIISQCISEIELFPAHLKKEVTGLSKNQLDTVYRPDGWTIRQVVHHCADSHMNALIRFKLALTENKPTIKPYPEHLFAELADSKNMAIEHSLIILEGVHARLTTLLRSMTEQDLKKVYVHPQYEKEFTLNEACALYAWHGKHHLAHITTLKRSEGWN